MFLHNRSLKVYLFRTALYLWKEGGLFQWLLFRNMTPNWSKFDRVILLDLFVATGPSRQCGICHMLIHKTKNFEPAHTENLNDPPFRISKIFSEKQLTLNYITPSFVWANFFNLSNFLSTVKRTAYETNILGPGTKFFFKKVGRQTSKIFPIPNLCISIFFKNTNIQKFGDTPPTTSHL